MTVHSNDLNLDGVLERYPSVSVSDARATIASLIDDVYDTGQRHLITRHGRALAVFVPMPDLLTLEMNDSTARAALPWPGGDVSATEPLDLEIADTPTDMDELLRKTNAAMRQDPKLAQIMSDVVDLVSPMCMVSGDSGVTPEQAL